MNPIKFPECNADFKAPPDLSESQVMTIPAFIGEVKTGSVDGLPMVVVAWQPSRLDLEDLNDGKPIFLTMIGGLAPHFLSTTFNQATNPA